MLQKKCKCKNGILFDSGEVFEGDKTYVCEPCGDWVTVYDKKGNGARLLIDGTFKSEFRML